VKNHPKLGKSLSGLALCLLSCGLLRLSFFIRRKYKSVRLSYNWLSFSFSLVTVAIILVSYDSDKLEIEE
jgi:uncharacterized membrane protein